VRSTLEQMMKINRKLASKATDYRFEIAESEGEESKLMEGQNPSECLTILRLYERKSD
jgi:hypothetical protein